MPAADTRETILEIAFDILATHGIDALSFDAIAARLGRSKQAVLYWFPNKHDLLAAMFLPSLTAEADTACRSLDKADTERQAIAAFVRAVAGFHCSDLNRFRMMYLAPQTTRPGQQAKPDDLLRDVHPITDRLYETLAARLEGDQDTRRTRAFAIHSAVLGSILMIALSDRLNDPLKHAKNDLIDALITTLTAPSP